MKPVITVDIDHQLKILPQYFQAVTVGDKSFEIRKNDRNYKVGDNIVLSEYEEGQYTGRNILAKITYITDYEQKDDYVVFGIEKYFDLDLVSNPPKSTTKGGKTNAYFARLQKRSTRNVFQGNELYESVW